MSKQSKIIMFSCLYIMGIITFFSDFIPGICIIIFALLYFLYFKKIISFKYLISLVLIFISGIINTHLNLKYSDDLSSYSDEKVKIEAKVLTIPSNSKPDKTNFFAKVTQITAENIDKKHINAASNIIINDKTEKIKKIKIGDTLELEGRIKTPNPAQNPSQFDYSKYLQYKKIFSSVYVNTEWEIKSQAQNLTGKALRNLNDIRTKIINIHAKNIDSPMLEILGGIIFGDDAVNPDENIKTAFINSGIFHILAASGMNVTLIFGIWFFFAQRFKFNYKFSLLTGMALIIFYTCMTGFGPPIIRASLMLILILTGKLIDRTTPTLALLFIVALLMLIYNPLMIFDIGFQLSFTVTFALILSSPLFVFNFKYKPVNYILGASMIPVAAQFYAAPLQMYYFNTFSLYSVFANIAIIPVLSIVSFIGFISSILALIPYIANKICFAADFILNPMLVYITKVANFFSNLPYSIILVPKPSILQLILYFSIIISITCIIRFKLFSKKLYLILSILVIFFISTLIKIPQNDFQMMFFSVGNADAILLKSPKNEYFLIDTGKLNYLSLNSQAKFIIIKYLRDKGIKNINSLIISHFDSDHAGGSIDILKNIKTDNVYFTDIYENTNLSDSIINFIKDNNKNYKIITDKTKIYEEKDFVINIIRPKGKDIITENENSLIVQCKYKDKNFLFMGDGDIKSYNSLPQNMKKNISVMKSGHHGAKNTINQEMIDNTDIFIISTGPNVYNHPNPETIKLLNDNSKKYLRTDYHNAINIKVKNNKRKIYIYSPNKNKFIKTDL